MCKVCIKCNSRMTVEEGVYICQTCLAEVLQVKRDILEESTWHEQQQGEMLGTKDLLYKLQEGKIYSFI